MNESRYVIDRIEVNDLTLRDDTTKAERKFAFPTVALGGSTPS